MADVTKIFKPRRGKSGTMASGAKAATVLQAGELFVELPSGGANTGDGHCKIKIGDGATAYSSLKYAIGDTANDKVLVDNNTSTTITSALNSATSDQPLKTVLGGLKRAINLCDTNINEMSGNLGIEITQAAYNALGNTVLTDNKTYFVSDAAGYDEMASQVSSLNSNLVANNQNFRFGYDSTSEKYGYILKEADTDVFHPFKLNPTLQGSDRYVGNRQATTNLTINLPKGTYICTLGGGLANSSMGKSMQVTGGEVIQSIYTDQGTAKGSTGYFLQNVVEITSSNGYVTAKITDSASTSYGQISFLSAVKIG